MSQTRKEIRQSYAYKENKVNYTKAVCSAFKPKNTAESQLINTSFLKPFRCLKMRSPFCWIVEHYGCVPLEWSEKRSVIWDHSDHGASRNRRILALSWFASSFVAPWSELSWITDPFSNRTTGTHPIISPPISKTPWSANRLLFPLEVEIFGFHSITILARNFYENC